MWFYITIIMVGTVPLLDGIAGMLVTLVVSTNLLHRALFGHVDGNPNDVTYIESGTEGPEEFARHMDDSQYLYGLRESVCVCVCVCMSL